MFLHYGLVFGPRLASALGACDKFFRHHLPGSRLGRLQVIATHKRSYGRREKVLHPLHFLVVLERKPAALDHAPVYHDWQLPWPSET